MGFDQSVRGVKSPDGDESMSLEAILAVVRDSIRAPFEEVGGSVTLSLSAESSKAVAVTFPSNRFTVAPLINFGKNSNGGKFIPQWSGKSTSGFTLSVISGDGSTYTGSITVDWTARQMAATAAAG